MISQITRTKTGALAWATIISGILDAIAAIIVYKIFYNYSPIQIYQFVASGILGSDAYAGGIPVALLGLTFHFFISFCASYLFFMVFPRFPVLGDNKIITGLLYGLIIWIVMNLMVIPMSKIPAADFDIVALLAIAWHMVLVGLPISLIITKYYKADRLV